MSNLIFDNRQSFSRFKQHYELSLVISGDKDIRNNYHGITKLSCCSDVKNTNNNWFYILNDSTIDIPLLSSWIDEISEAFPQFEIKIISVPSYNLISCTEINNSITVNLPLSNYSDRYGVTNKSNYPRGDFFAIKDLYINARNYLVEEFKKSGISVSKESLVNFIEKFFNSTYFTTYIKNTMMYYADAVSRGNISMYVRDGRSFEIDTRAIDYNDPDVDSLLKEYTIKVMENNFNLVIDDKEIPCIQALYSNPHSGNVLTYLAHILIRAGIVPDTINFVKQYFYIKEKTPGLYFWNRIFLTQFGFNFNSEYWLTSGRVFKFTNENTFNNTIKGFYSTSANEFFRLFHWRSVSEGVFSKLKDLYLAEKFDDFIESCSTVITVKLKPEYKNKFPNLMISDKYEVYMSEGDSYYISGDDYKLRKYKKDNFIIWKNQ